MARAIQVDFLLAGLFDSSGNPLSGGKVKTLNAGLTSPKATYQDAAKSVPHQNPIILNSLGRAVVFADGTYDFEIYDANDVLITTLPNLYYIVQEQAARYGGLSTGAANIFSITTDPPETLLADGQWYRFIAHQNTTGASQCIVDGLPAIPIKKGSGATDTALNDIVAGQVVDLIIALPNARLTGAAGGVWGLSQGGTGASDAPGARASLGAAKSGANIDITSIVASTSDGADNASLQFSGGGGVANSRGGHLALFGNEHATEAGRAYLNGGNGEIRLLTVAKAIEFHISADKKWEIEPSSGFLLPKNNLDIGSGTGPRRVGNFVFNGKLIHTNSGSMTYTLSNVTPNRSFNADANFDAVSWANVLDVLGTLLTDLKSTGPIA